MIVITFPQGLNWFYERLARALELELKSCGMETLAVPAHSLADLVASPDTILVIAPAESAVSVERSGRRAAFVEAIQKFRLRIVVNYDSIHSEWFAKNFRLDADLFTHIFDINASAQTHQYCEGLPYVWIPEAQWLYPATLNTCSWTPDRAFPWAVIGHENKHRVGLVSALLKCGKTNGFVYVPPLKPYTEKGGGGLSQGNLRKVLEQSEFYVWNSHHLHPYHEGLRALQAVCAGAIPAKIDPLYANQFSHLPWVYSSLSDLFCAYAAVGSKALYEAARSHIATYPRLGISFSSALVELAIPTA